MTRHFEPCVIHHNCVLICYNASCVIIVPYVRSDFLSLEKVAILTFLFSGLDDFFRFQNCNFFATNTISYCSELKLEE